MNGTRVHITSQGLLQYQERMPGEMRYEDLSLESQELLAGNPTARFDKEHFESTGELQLLVPPPPTVEAVAATKALEFAQAAALEATTGKTVAILPDNTFQVDLDTIGKLDDVYRLMADYMGAPGATPANIRDKNRVAIDITLDDLKTLIMQLGIEANTLWTKEQSKKDDIQAIVDEYNADTIDADTARANINALTWE